jgi:hypothetical protein
MSEWNMTDKDGTDYGLFVGNRAEANAKALELTEEAGVKIYTEKVGTTVVTT